MFYELQFLKALALTVLVESLALVTLARRVWKIGRQNLSWPRLLFAGFFASFATIPYVWFILPLWRVHYLFRDIVGEALVVIVEALAYVFLLNVTAKRAACLSVVANLASVLVGLLAM